MKYTAMVACGNYNGVIGFAKAKGPAVPVALQKVFTVSYLVFQVLLKVVWLWTVSNCSVFNVEKFHEFITGHKYEEIDLPLFQLLVVSFKLIEVLIYVTNLVIFYGSYTAQGLCLWPTF